MNKEYLVHNDEVIVVDEFNNERKSKNYDNLKEILETENKIERLEIEKTNALISRDKNYEYQEAFTTIKKVLLTILLFVIGTKILFMFVPSIFTYAVYGSVLICSFVAVPVFVSLFAALYYHFKERNRGINSALEYIDQELTKEKQKLVELDRNKSIVKENQELKINHLNYEKETENITNLTNLYYDIGENPNKYIKYLNNGQLDTILRDYYDKDKEEAREYIKTKSLKRTRK